LPPTHPDADAGFVIMEQVEYPPMSGSNTICVATVLLETGIVTAKEPVTEFTLESPAGLIPVRAEVFRERPRIRSSLGCNYRRAESRQGYR
jgi:proline racemase